MFSFHKPKIYRSNLGCCICKAKSSSSRFTDSKKYENEFEHCFRIEEPRSGEICNACVLLVKRWKKLSPENRSIKHWNHVVDARAGPGTKLTSGRRFTGSHHNTSNADSSPGTSAQSAPKQRQYSSTGSGSRSAETSGPLPLSSSQSANQSGSSATGSGGRRSSSFSKARAIDTNVSTFTFGEPIRRSYMTAESSFSSSSSALHKPQSALNSSAFESVIKRFRQRQQQQQLEAERRQLNKQQRLSRQQQQLQQQGSSAQDKTTKSAGEQRKQPLAEQQVAAVAEETTSSSGSISQAEDSNSSQAPPSKRVKRSSESIGSLCVDGLRVSSLLDGSVWRKERICCGIIFRGLHNEVVVFPKLLKPCQCRQERLKRQMPAAAQQQQQIVDDDGEDEEEEETPKPRVNKSGSISSCDSNTSGTGSMEPSAEELAAAARSKRPALAEVSPAPHKLRRKTNQTKDSPTADEWPTSDASAAKRPRPTRASRRQQQPSRKSAAGNDTDSIISSSSSVLSSIAEPRQQQQQRGGPAPSPTAAAAGAQVNSPGSSTSSASSSSSSRRLLMAQEELDAEEEDELGELEEMEELEEEDQLIMDEDEEIESNTDASSSVESLAEVERKKSSGGNPVGAMG